MAVPCRPGGCDGATLAGPVPPRPALTGDSVLALVHTSGTTGRAKAIPLRHGALMVSVADFAIEVGDQVAGSHHLQILPLFHLGGFGQCMQALLTAGTVHIHTVFNPAAVIDAIEADRIEFFTAGPSLIDMLVAEVRRRARARRPVQPARDRLRHRADHPVLADGGDRDVRLPVPADLRQHREPVHDQPAGAGGPPAGPSAAGQRGEGLVRLGGADRRPGRQRRCRPSTPGELLIRGECLFSGYWRDPEATAAAFADGGWYRTGDIARLTADGYLYILDRAKDMIISGGENIYPAEVEAVLAGHPAVADVAVVGRPDARWGEAVHAVIIPAAGQAGAVTAEEVIGWCRERLAHFKCPKSVEFTASFPRTTTGKVLKRELRAQLAEQDKTGHDETEEPRS